MGKKTGCLMWGVAIPLAIIFMVSEHSVEARAGEEEAQALAQAKDYVKREKMEAAISVLEVIELLTPQMKFVLAWAYYNKATGNRGTNADLGQAFKYAKEAGDTEGAEDFLKTFQKFYASVTLLPGDGWTDPGKISLRFMGTAADKVAVAQKVRQQLTTGVTLPLLVYLPKGVSYEFNGKSVFIPAVADSGEEGVERAIRVPPSLEMSSEEQLKQPLFTVATFGAAADGAPLGISGGLQGLYSSQIAGVTIGVAVELWFTPASVDMFGEGRFGGAHLLTTVELPIWKKLYGWVGLGPAIQYIDEVEFVGASVASIGFSFWKGFSLEFQLRGEFGTDHGLLWTPLCVRWSEGGAL